MRYLILVLISMGNPPTGSISRNNSKAIVNNIFIRSFRIMIQQLILTAKNPERVLKVLYMNSPTYSLGIEGFNKP